MLYVGINNLYRMGTPVTTREVFRSKTTPTTHSHGHRFVAVVGPFRTVRGAKFLAENPSCRTVRDAETSIVGT